MKVGRDLIITSTGIRVRQAVIRHTLAKCRDIGIRLLQEGVVTVAEFESLKSIGWNASRDFILQKREEQLTAVPVEKLS